MNGYKASMNMVPTEVKRVFQRPDGFWPIGEDTLLTDEEFEKLMDISDCSWIIIMNPEYNNGKETL